MPKDIDRPRADEDLISPEHVLHAIDAAGGPGEILNSLFRMWSIPIQGSMARIGKTIDKPVGQMTMPEIVDWVFVLAYAGMTGYVAGKVVAGALTAAADHRRR